MYILNLYNICILNINIYFISLQIMNIFSYMTSTNEF